MFTFRTLVAGAVLAALTASKAAAAQNAGQNANCLSEREVTSLVTYALPVVRDSATKACNPQLPPEGYFATQGSSLVQRYAARKGSAWPEVKAALLKLGGKDKKMKSMIASLSDEALQPFADEFVSQMIVKGIKPGQCKSIERVNRLLSPLPPENTAELLTFVTVLAEKPSVRGAQGAPKKSDFPICPA
jgi:hypothetical protein